MSAGPYPTQQQHCKTTENMLAEVRAELSSKQGVAVWGNYANTDAKL